MLYIKNDSYHNKDDGVGGNNDDNWNEERAAKYDEIIECAVYIFFKPVYRAGHSSFYCITLNTCNRNINIVELSSLLLCTINMYV